MSGEGREGDMLKFMAALALLPLAIYGVMLLVLVAVKIVELVLVGG